MSHQPDLVLELNILRKLGAIYFCTRAALVILDWMYELTGDQILPMWMLSSVSGTDNVLALCSSSKGLALDEWDDNVYIEWGVVMLHLVLAFLILHNWEHESCTYFVHK